MPRCEAPIENGHGALEQRHGHAGQPHIGHQAAEIVARQRDALERRHRGPRFWASALALSRSRSGTSLCRWRLSMRARSLSA